MHLFRKGEWLALLVAGVVLGLLFFLKYAPPRMDRRESYIVIIESEKGAEEILVTPEDEKELTIPGPLGKTVLAVKGGEVFVVTSPCPDKVCIKMGKIPHIDFIACVPNRVVIRLKR